MIWAKRMLLALPPAIAGVLTVLISLADQLHLRLERVAGFGFLFGGPWAWLLDHPWFASVQSRWVQWMVEHATILWIPALLYSGCLWLLQIGRAHV